MDIVLHRMNENGNLSNDKLIITEQRKYTIGRSRKNYFRLKTECVSKYHCVIHHNEVGFFLEVLKTRRSLFVNNKEYKKFKIVALNDGDIIQICDKYVYKLLLKTPGVEISQSKNLPIKSEPKETDLESQNKNLITNSKTVSVNQLENVQKTSTILDSFDKTESTYVTNSQNASELTNSEQNFNFPEQSDVISSSQIDQAMQISINKNDNKCLLIPLAENVNSVSKSFDLSIKTSSKQSKIKVESPDIPSTNPKMSTKDPLLNSETNKTEPNVSEIVIKVENPDMTPTNLSLFAKDFALKLGRDSSKNATQLKKHLLFESRQNLSTETEQNPDASPINATLFENHHLTDLELYRNQLEERIKREILNASPMDENFLDSDSLADLLPDNFSKEIIEAENTDDSFSDFNEVLENYLISSAKTPNLDEEMTIKIEEPNVNFSTGNSSFLEDENSRIQKRLDKIISKAVIATEATESYENSRVKNEGKNLFSTMNERNRGSKVKKKKTDYRKEIVETVCDSRRMDEIIEVSGESDESDGIEFIEEVRKRKKPTLGKENNQDIQSVQIKEEENHPVEKESESLIEQEKNHLEEESPSHQFGQEKIHPVEKETQKHKLEREKIHPVEKESQNREFEREKIHPVEKESQNREFERKKIHLVEKEYQNHKFEEKIHHLVDENFTRSIKNEKEDLLTEEGFYGSIVQRVLDHFSSNIEDLKEPLEIKDENVHSDFAIQEKPNIGESSEEKLQSSDSECDDCSTDDYDDYEPYRSKISEGGKQAKEVEDGVEPYMSKNSETSFRIEKQSGGEIGQKDGNDDNDNSDKSVRENCEVDKNNNNDKSNLSDKNYHSVSNDNSVNKYDPTKNDNSVNNINKINNVNSTKKDHSVNNDNPTKTDNSVNNDNPTKNDNPVKNSDKNDVTVKNRKEKRKESRKRKFERETNREEKIDGEKETDREEKNRTRSEKKNRGSSEESRSKKRKELEKQKGNKRRSRTENSGADEKKRKSEEETRRDSDSRQNIDSGQNNESRRNESRRNNESRINRDSRQNSDPVRESDSKRNGESKRDNGSRQNSDSREESDSKRDGDSGRNNDSRQDSDSRRKSVSRRDSVLRDESDSKQDGDSKRGSDSKRVGYSKRDCNAKQENNLRQESTIRDQNTSKQPKRNAPTRHEERIIQNGYPTGNSTPESVATETRNRNEESSFDHFDPESISRKHPKDLERDPRLRPVVQNYTYGRTECPEERQTSLAFTQTSQPTGKKKLNLQAYRDRRNLQKPKEPSSVEAGNIVPLTTFGSSTNRLPQAQKDSGSRNPFFKEMNTQPQGFNLPRISSTLVLYPRIQPLESPRITPPEAIPKIQSSGVPGIQQSDVQHQISTISDRIQPLATCTEIPHSRVASSGIHPLGFQTSGVPSSGIQYPGVPPLGIQPLGVPSQENRFLGVPSSENRHLGVPPPENRHLGVPYSGNRPLGVQPPGIQPLGVPPPEMQSLGIPPSRVSPPEFQPLGVSPLGMRTSGVSPIGIQPSGVPSTGIQPSGVPPPEIQSSRVTPPGIQPLGVPSPVTAPPLGTTPLRVSSAGIPSMAVEIPGVHPAVPPVGVPPVGVPPVGPIGVQPVRVQPIGVPPVGVPPVGVQPIGVQPVVPPLGNTPRVPLLGISPMGVGLSGMGVPPRIQPLAHPEVQAPSLQHSPRLANGSIENMLPNKILSFNQMPQIDPRFIPNMVSYPNINKAYFYHGMYPYFSLPALPYSNFPFTGLDNSSNGQVGGFPVNNISSREKAKTIVLGSPNVETSNEETLNLETSNLETSNLKSSNLEISNVDSSDDVIMTLVDSQSSRGSTKSSDKLLLKRSRRSLKDKTDVSKVDKHGGRVEKKKRTKKNVCRDDEGRKNKTLINELQEENRTDEVLDVDENETIDEYVMKNIISMKITKPKIVSSVEQGFVSDDMKDELLSNIFSWEPNLFKNDLSLIDYSPIRELRNAKQISLSYSNYDSYHETFFKNLLLHISTQIQNAVIFANKDAIINVCFMLPQVIEKIKCRDVFLVPLCVKMRLPSQTDFKPPANGDLLSLSIIKEKNDKSVIFSYIEKIYSEDIKGEWKWITCLLSLKHPDFDMHKCTIQNVQLLLNMKSHVEMARVFVDLKKSPLFRCIMRPNPEIKQEVPKNFFLENDLVCQEKLDQKQLMAMTRVIKSYYKNEPNICVVDGSAGTGKTNLIVNMIFQLFASLMPSEKDNFRILICASTNSEIDEIVNRVSKEIERLKLEKDENTGIRIVVLGNEEERRERAKDLNLSRFARHHVNNDIKKYQGSLALRPLKEQVLFIKEQIKSLTEKFDEANCDIVGLQTMILKKYFSMGKSGRMVKDMTVNEKQELIDQAEITFLNGANLIFSSVHNLTDPVMNKFKIGCTIPVCIVDEATQIPELETLKVLGFGVRTLVLFGDISKSPSNNDLPERLKRNGWRQSLFSRIVENFENSGKSPIVNLQTQYRMAPTIDNWLCNSKSFGINTVSNAVSEQTNFPLLPLIIFNLRTEEFINDEAVFASTLVHCIVHYGDLRRLERSISVGIIISHADAKQQVEQEIENRLEDVIPGKKKLFNVEINTVDKFVNQEKDIVLVSCIRNKHLTSSAGFQRFYSAVTRAKHCLIIYGRFSKFGKPQKSRWHRLVDYTKNVETVNVYVESQYLRKYVIR